MVSRRVAEILTLVIDKECCTPIIGYVSYSSSMASAVAVNEEKEIIKNLSITEVSQKYCFNDILLIQHSTKENCHRRYRRKRRMEIVVFMTC